MIVSGIITIACGLGMRVVAEGVETTAQLDFLRDHGCHAAQGYLYSRPLEADDLYRFLEESAEFPARVVTTAP